MAPNPRPPIGPWLVLAGAVTTTVGCLLPWVVATIPFVETIRGNGIDAGPRGWVVLGGAVAAAVVGAAASRRQLHRSWSLVLLALGVAAVVATGYDAVVVLDGLAELRAQGVTSARVGSGLVLANVGAVLVLAGATCTVVAGRRRAEVARAERVEGWPQAA